MLSNSRAGEPADAIDLEQKGLVSDQRSWRWTTVLGRGKEVTNATQPVSVAQALRVGVPALTGTGLLVWGGTLVKGVDVVVCKVEPCRRRGGWFGKKIVANRIGGAVGDRSRCILQAIHGLQ